MNEKFNNHLKKGKGAILFKLLLGKILFSILLTGSYFLYHKHKKLSAELIILKEQEHRNS